MKRVPFRRLASLALRQLLRDARGGELRVLFGALLIAVAASTAIGYFGARLNDAMLLRATEFLGADLVLRGSAPAEPEQIAAGARLQLDHARVVEFSSVVATDENLQLTSVKAADDHYPLRGELRSAPAPYQPEHAGPGPKPGEAWAEARLFAALDLQVGDHIEVGNKPLRLTRVLTYEPDRVGDFYSLTPRVLMHLDDLDATGVVQPGSRVRYRELWRGEPAQLQAYEEAIKPNLQPHQRIETAKDGNRQIGGALGRAERYLNLASLAAVLLAGVAVALSAARFAARRFDASALLRCLGLSRREALLLYTLQLGYLGIAASVVGALLGWAAQHGLFFLLRELVVSEVPPATLWPALAGIATGLVALAAIGCIGARTATKGTTPRYPAGPAKHLAGIRHRGSRPWPDYVAPEPGLENHACPAGWRPDRDPGPRRALVAGTTGLAPRAIGRFADMAPGSWPAASSPACGRRSVAGLRPDITGDGPDCAAARRVAGYLAEPAPGRCT